MNRMQLVRRLIFLACAVAAVTAIRITYSRIPSASAANIAPTPEFMAAAMKDQEKPGMAVEVQYSWTTSAKSGETSSADVETTVDTYYVRAPRFIFSKQAFTGHVDPATDTSNVYIANYTTSALYNRITGRYRELRTHDSGGPAQGKVTYDTWDVLMPMTTVESVVGFFASTSLYFMVEHGYLKEQKKEIDGHECWGVAYDEDPGIQGHVIWVDPKIGFCPRRIDLVLKNKLRVSKTMRLYRELGQGVWFPKEVVVDDFSKTGEHVSSRAITEIEARLVPVDEESKLKLEFPPGVVIDSDEGEAK